MKIAVSIVFLSLSTSTNMSLVITDPRYITEYNIILQTLKVNCVMRGCHVGLAGSQRDNIELSLLSLSSMIKR